MFFQHPPSNTPVLWRGQALSEVGVGCLDFWMLRVSYWAEGPWAWGRAHRESIHQAHARKVLLAGIAGHESGVSGGSLRQGAVSGRWYGWRLPLNRPRHSAVSGRS